MVGVPGRSKSCNTCRRRKIACSLEKPQCAQCVKSNRVCAGYQRERIFISNHGGNEGGGAKTYTRQPPGETPQKDGGVLPSLRDKESKRSNSSNHFTASKGAIVKKIPSRFAYQQQLLSEFLRRCTPIADQTVQRKEDNGWLELLIESPPSTRALETSIAAVCIASLGRQHDDLGLVKDSLKYYWQGLRELQKALWDPKLMYKDETLAACMALFMYELIECPAESRIGLISHIDGCARLIQLRGAEAHRSALGHQIFLAFRLDGIVRAMECRRSTFLSDPEWMELPWKGLSKTIHDQIIDVLADIAKIVGQAYEMANLSLTEPLSVIPAIVDHCWMLAAKLRRLYTDLESRNLGPLYWSKFSIQGNPVDDPALGKVFPIAFHFPSLRVAQTCMMYWTASIVLWSILSPTYQVLGAMKYDMSGLPILEDQLDVVALARNVCQSLEYCLQDEMQGLGPAIAMIPLHLVIKILADYPSCSRELSWSKAVARSVSKKGIRISDYIPL